MLDDAGIHRGGVVRDSQGTSAQALRAGLVAGQAVALGRDPARGRLTANGAPLAHALEEPLSERQRGLLQAIQRRRRDLEAQIHPLVEHLLAALAPYRPAWQVLPTLRGIDTRRALPRIAELGGDRDRCGSAERLASGAGMGPGQPNRAGKRQRVATPPGQRALGQMLCAVAKAACQSDSQVNGQYPARLIWPGHQRSILGRGHTLWPVVSTVLKAQQPYRAPAIDDAALVVVQKAPRWLKALQKYGSLAETHPVAA